MILFCNILETSKRPRALQFLIKMLMLPEVGRAFSFKHGFVFKNDWLTINELEDRQTDGQTDGRTRNKY